MKEIHLKRLERLAKEHEKRAKRGEKLDMRTYAHNCKTPACSLGHACFIPEFRKAGLRLDHDLDPTYRGEHGSEFFLGKQPIVHSDPEGWSRHSALEGLLFGYTPRSHARQARVLRNFIAKQRKAMKQKRGT